MALRESCPALTNKTYFNQVRPIISSSDSKRFEAMSVVPLPPVLPHGSTLSNAGFTGSAMQVLLAQRAIGLVSALSLLQRPYW